MSCNRNRTDFGPNPDVLHIEQMAKQNEDFRRAVWTGCYLQMTVMCIPRRGDVGVEMHDDTDQMIRVEEGYAIIRMGNCKCNLDYQQRICMGDVFIIPAGTWHNIINTGNCPLKLSSVYAPPSHPRGTIHDTKEEAERAHY